MMDLKTLASANADPKKWRKERQEAMDKAANIPPYGNATWPSGLSYNEAKAKGLLRWANGWTPPVVTQPVSELLKTAPNDYWLGHTPSQEDAFTVAEVSQGIVADLEARQRVNAALKAGESLFDMPSALIADALGITDKKVTAMEYKPIHGGYPSPVQPPKSTGELTPEALLSAFKHVGSVSGYVDPPEDYSTVNADIPYNQTALKMAADWNTGPVIASGNPNEFSPADDDGRMVRVGDHDPEPLNTSLFKVEDNQAKTGLPPIYFDGVRTSIALDDIIRDTQEQKAKLQVAMQNVRLNASAFTVSTLTKTIDDITAAADIKARITVNELSNTIEGMANSTVYSVVPIGKFRSLIAQLRAIFANTDG
jgi:hypothetical protein